MSIVRQVINGTAVLNETLYETSPITVPSIANIDLCEITVEVQENQQGISLAKDYNVVLDILSSTTIKLYRGGNSGTLTASYSIIEYTEESGVFIENKSAFNSDLLK